MKNTVRSILILSLVSIFLMACSSDDTEPESTGNKFSAPTINGKRLVKIKQGDTFTSLEYNSQGQVSKVKHHSKDGTIRENSYWYEDRSVIWSPYKHIYNISNGYAVECNFTALTSDDENAMTVECQESYLYDAQGCLLKAIKPPYDFAEEDPINEIYNYTWKDGNIISVTEKTSRENIILSENTEFIINYTTIENTIPLFFTYYYSNNLYLEWQGYFGKRCKNLPLSVTFINHTMEPSWDGYSTTYHYSYTVEDGLITKIAVESTTNKGISSKDTYELEWW